MNIFGLGDGHFSFVHGKEMSIFGEHWQDHPEQIAENWQSVVAPDDLVLLPGDLSWATRLEDVLGEFAFLHDLPGKKVLSKGNHDFWWQSISKVRKMLPPSISVIQNDAVTIGNVTIGGARGWNQPDLSFAGFYPENDEKEFVSKRGEHYSPEDDQKICEREVQRLENSLLKLDDSASVRIAMIHFPPTNHLGEDTAFTEVLEKHGVQHCVFGHLHGDGTVDFNNPFLQKNGITYHLVSADFVNFNPHLIATA